METKQTIKDLKNKIKVLAQEQVFLKNQRKTVKLQGERKMEPWKAWYQHQSNRSGLRKFYLIYSILKGKDPKSIDPKFEEFFSIDLLKVEAEDYNGEVIRSGS